MPKAKRVGVLRDSKDPTWGDDLAVMAPAADALGLTLVFADFSDAASLDSAITRLIEAHVDAIYPGSANAPVALYANGRIFEQTNRAHLPVFSSWVGSADRGALFVYAGSYVARMRRQAQWIDKILRGAKPAELPVEQVTEVEFIVNTKSARALGITIPPAVLLRADRIIE